MALFRRSTGMEIITQGPELRLIVNAKCTQLDVRVTDHFSGWCFDTDPPAYPIPGNTYTSTSMQNRGEQAYRP